MGPSKNAIEEKRRLLTLASIGDAVFTTDTEVEVRLPGEQDRTILESITDAFFAVDRDWRFSYVNPQAERMLDRQPGDLLGHVIWEEYPGLIGSQFETAYHRVVNERITLSV